MDRYAAWNPSFVPVAPDPHSGPRRAKRAKETLATSRGLRWDIKGGARDWLEFLRDARIKDDPALLDESRQLARIFAQSVKTARENTTRIKKRPKS
ncbi:MAG TPA: hypothetical protein VGQ10_17200 [Vicinamibacterales bacterium]|nr:hypothetical protein [Vicinamibacterales bacterium]